MTCRHWPWRRWRLVWWVTCWVLDPVGLAYGVLYDYTNGHRGCQTIHWRWTR